MARRRFQKGSVSMRGTRRKVWVGRWREYVVDPNGVERAINKKEVLGTLKDFETKKLALRELESRISNVNRYDYRPTSLMTFGVFVERWKEDVLKHHKPSTQSSVRAHISRQLLPSFGTITLRDISTERIQRFVGSLDVAPKTTRNILSTMRMVWKAARAWGYVHHNPFEGLILPRKQTKEKIIYTKEQVTQILNATREPFKTMFWLLAETGMRIGEVLALRIGDVDVPGQLLHVRQSVWRGKVTDTKTASGRRDFAISAALAAALRRLGEGFEPGTFVFRTRTGKPHCGHNVLRWKLYKIADTLGIPRLGFHSLRHANATWLDEMDVPLKTRQVRLGHSDPSITIGIYSHRSVSADRDFAEKISSVLWPVCVQDSESNVEVIDSKPPNTVLELASQGA